MSEIINLRQFKKNKARASREEQASQNRILFGQTKAEKSFAKEKARKTNSFLENNRLEPVSKQDAED
ncbi:DUF4169 family protein [Brucella gallinifaecis]|uniref:DUF4169 family protein n=1 Tax=Brucella gallinifaecis TaxID=215590 RepID=A0A502BQ31_9HYPH|nr:DUF4169 family protein [Brucella gallinifaecis]TPF76652.1 DUF4169 family protein [Brucella gallinifaecis]